jgi:YHS domain-containing protein
MNVTESDQHPRIEWTECNGATPAPGTPVQTACGSMVEYTGNTPCINFRGERIYFCLAICKADFENNPSASCLAPRL